MATIGNTYYNLADYFRSMSPDGSIEADILEILATLTPLIDDAVTIEANNGTSHIHTIRDTLPSVTWGRLYQGIPQSKSSRAMVTDTTGFVEGLSTVDTRLLDIAPNPAALRESEGMAFLESLTQEAETGIFYHDSAATPEKFKGLAARYNTLSNPNVVNGGGTGSDNTRACPQIGGARLSSGDERPLIPISKTEVSHGPSRTPMAYLPP